MKKTLLIGISVVLLAACKEKKTSSTAPNNNCDETTKTASGADAEMTAWLKGKILTADDPSKDYHNFKLYADGMCEDKGGTKVSWLLKDNKLNMGGMMKIDIEKKDDNTLIMHRSLSDETYKVSAMP